MDIGKQIPQVGGMEIRPLLLRFSVRMGFHKQNHLASFMGVFVAMLLLASCTTTKLFGPSTVGYRDEAGGVLLSVNSACRWEQVAEAIQPKFNLANGDAALSKVLPATARFQQQILDAFGFSLGLGLPQSFRESLVTQTIGESQSSAGTTSSQGYTSTTTETTKPGTAPATPVDTPAGGEFPSGMALGSDLGLDPLLQYRAAASLYQAVQLMNREVELAATRKGFIPYMVRMQLATIPYRRHLPYDVYAQVEFFPSGKTLPFSKANADTLLPYVVPLIVTDNLEQAIKSRSAEVARQIGLAVNLMVQGVGGNVGSNWEKRNRESVLAADVNSLLTVARLNDNGIYIRLGAANEATGENSLVGRTYDIALLLLVPQDYFDLHQNFPNSGLPGSDSGPVKNFVPPTTPSEQPAILSVITHTDLRDASSGELLKERREVSLAEQVDNALSRALRIRHRKMYEAWSRTPQDEKLRMASRLIAAIQTSEYARFYQEAYSIKLNPDAKAGAAIDRPSKEKCTICAGGSDPNPEDNAYRLACISEGYLRSLWSYLASTVVESSTKSASVELPMLPDIVIPKQTALMRDDGKEKIEIVLRDISGITPREISAKIVLINSGGTPYEFPAETISPDPATGTLALKFPSPAKWNLGTIDYDKSQLIVERRPCSFGRACAIAKIDSPFAVRHAAAPAEKPKPGFDLRASTNEIVVDKGSGAVKLIFDDFKDDSAVLTWNGAEVKSVKNSDGTPVEITLDKISVKSGTVLTLEIQNVKPDGKVMFKAVGVKDGKKTGEATKEFTAVAGK